MDLVLQSLQIKYNSANFVDYDGTPPKTYSAIIELSSKIGKTTTKLSEQDIIAIMGVVCNRVAENMRELAQTTATDIQRAVNGNVLAHEVVATPVEDELPF